MSQATHSGHVTTVQERAKCVFFNARLVRLVRLVKFRLDCRDLTLAHVRHTVGEGLVRNVELVQIRRALLQAFPFTALYRFMKVLVPYNSGWSRTVIVDFSLVFPAGHLCALYRFAHFQLQVLHSIQFSL